MKKVLVLYYSQSGQLKNMVDSVTGPLNVSDEVQVDYRKIKPVEKYPYPWPFYPFFDAFPEAIYMNGCDVEPLDDLADDYDLIILGYTIWFLSPSIPVTGFMQSEQAKGLFKDKPVVTLIACRDMWVMAQEKMKNLLSDVGATLIDNVVLTDQGGYRGFRVMWIGARALALRAMMPDKARKQGNGGGVGQVLRVDLG